MPNAFEVCNFAIPQDQCTPQTCCLAQSSFAYLPSLGGNLFFAIFFGVFIVPQLYLGIRYRTHGFLAGMTIGLALEVVGYASRVWLHYDPFSNNAFLIYLILLTIAPVFLSAAIYLTLTRTILLWGEHLSFIRARLVAQLFMASDFLSLVLQAVGGALAEIAVQDNKDASTGTDIMIAGLLLQAVSLAVFSLLWAVFMLRVWRASSSSSSSSSNAGPDPTPAKVAVRTRTYYAVSQVGLVVATLAVLIRSIFRVVELWGGFAGSVWNDETDFLVLDGAMIALATVLLTVLHPGPAFGAQWNVGGWGLSRRKRASAASSEVNSKAAIIPEVDS